MPAVVVELPSPTAVTNLQVESDASKAGETDVLYFTFSWENPQRAHIVAVFDGDFFCLPSCFPCALRTKKENDGGLF